MTQRSETVHSTQETLSARLHELRLAYAIVTRPEWKTIQSYLDSNEAAIVRHLKVADDPTLIHRFQGQLKSLSEMRNLAEVLASDIRTAEANLEQLNRIPGE